MRSLSMPAEAPPPAAVVVVVVAKSWKKKDKRVKMAYPCDILSEEELLNAGTPDWEEVTPSSYHKYKRFIPTVFEGMLDQLELHMYWVNKYTNQEYSLVPYFNPPKAI